MNPYYTALPVPTYFEPEIYDKLYNPNTDWVKYFNFTTCLIDDNILTKDKFYKWLHERHPFKAGVLKMESKTIYNWHTDSTRGVCINTLLSSNHGSFTFFRDNESLNHNLIELQYYSGSRYLFNNQKDHMVLNYNSSARFVLTTEFLEDKNKLNYLDLLEEIKQEFTQ